MAARLTKEGEKRKKKSFKNGLNGVLSKGAWSAGMHEKQRVRQSSQAERFAL